jgi:hypothetical protein
MWPFWLLQRVNAGEILHRLAGAKLHQRHHQQEGPDIGAFLLFAFQS